MHAPAAEIMPFLSCLYSFSSTEDSIVKHVGSEGGGVEGGCEGKGDGGGEGEGRGGGKGEGGGGGKGEGGTTGKASLGYLESLSSSRYLVFVVFVVFVAIAVPSLCRDSPPSFGP